MSMSRIFIEIFNLSAQATLLILVIALLRPLLKRAPKWTVCLMWSLAAIRLAIPFSLESPVSIVPSGAVIPHNIGTSKNPSIESGIDAVDKIINPIIKDNFAPVIHDSVNPMQVVMEVSAYVWMAGALIMIAYGIISYARLYFRVRPSIKYRDNIYYCDNIDTPFILGFIRPRIYVPSGMREDCLEYVLKHEYAHIKRLDYIWKIAGYLILSVYWFNPLVWLGYVLFCRDVESACDERVIKEMDAEQKKEYSEALVLCSMKRRIVIACPLAFGEVGVRQRIKSVLSYKKPTLWIIIASVVAIAVVAACLLTNQGNEGTENPPDGIIGAELLYSAPKGQLVYESPVSYTDKDILRLAAEKPALFTLDISRGVDLYVCEAYQDDYMCFLFSKDGCTESDYISIGQTVNGVALSEKELAIILDYYKMPVEYVNIYSFFYGFSSWLPFSKGTEFSINKFRARIMLDSNEREYIAVYDTMDYDVDGDRRLETCIVAAAPMTDSSMCNFVLAIYDKESGGLKYSITMPFGDGELYLDGSKDYQLYIRNSRSSANGNMYAVEIENGKILFTYNGNPVDRLVPWEIK